jgi:regulator of replication initiation timing
MPTEVEIPITDITAPVAAEQASDLNVPDAATNTREQSPSSAQRLATAATAGSTHVGDNSAIQLYNEYAEAMGLSKLADITDVQVEGDNITDMIADFGIWLASTNIKNKSVKKKVVFITPGTKVEYFGKLKEEMHRKFRHHECWRREEDWYSKMRDSVKIIAARIGLNGGDTNNLKTHGIYKRNTEGLLSEPWPSDSAGARDLEGVCEALIKSPRLDASLRRIGLIVTYSADGRGGECKFLRYDTMRWDQKFGVAVGLWKEPKTLTQHPMPFGPDADGMECDFFHAMGSYWILSRGLFRTEEQKGIEDFVFCEFHRIADSTVTTNLSNTIRDNVADDMKPFMKARSLRYGATTTLAVHRDISHQELLGRGGWSAGNEEYYIQRVMALLLPGQRALAGWSDCHRTTYPPRLECLGSPVLPMLDSYMNELYVNSLVYFKERGSLRPFMRACTASLIMYYNDMLSKYGGNNRLVYEMLKVAKKVNICDGDNADERHVLQSWSTKIKDDFLLQNSLVSDCDGDAMAELKSNVQQMLQIQQKTLRVINDLSIKHAATDQVLREVRTQVTHLAQQNYFLTQENQQLREKVNETPLRRSPRRPKATAPTAALSTTTLPDSSAAGEQPKKASSTFQQLMQAQQALVTTANDGRNQSRQSVSDIILILHEAKVLQNEDMVFENCWAPTSLPIPNKDKKLFERTMRLVDSVITPAQRNILKDKDLNRETLTQIAHAIEGGAMEKLRELEGGKKKNKRESATYTGIGNRIKKIKK